jgi:WD40 repeat protein
LLAVSLLLLPASALAGPPRPRTDLHGRPLPPGAIARIGSTHLRHPLGAPCLAFAPDGKRLASLARDGTLRVWDVATGKELQQLRGHGLSLAFKADGKTLLAISLEGMMRFYDLPASKQVREFSVAPPEGRERFVPQFALTPDGRTLVTASNHGALLWEAATGKQLRRIGGEDPKTWYYTFALSPDGRTVALGGREVHLYEVTTGKALGSLKVAHQPGALAFSPDGQVLAVGDTWRDLELWDVTARKRLHTAHGHKAWIESVAYSPDNKLIATGSRDQTARVWDAATGELRATLGPFPGAMSQGEGDRIKAVAFSPDGKVLAAAGEDGFIRLWDAQALATGKVRELRPPTGLRRAPTFVALSPDGRTVLAGGGYPERVVILWDADTGKELRRLEGHKDWVTTAVFAPDGKQIATASRDGTIRFWDAATAKEVAHFGYYRPGSPDVTGCLAYSPDGKRIAHSAFRLAFVRAVPTGKVVHELAMPAAQRAQALVFSADGKFLVAGCDRGQVHLWEVATGKKAQTIGEGFGLLFGVAMTPDSKRVVSASRLLGFQVWDAATGKEVHRFDLGKFAHLMDPSAALSPDGRTMAGGAGYHADPESPVRLWEMATGKERRRLSAHTGMVRGVSFSADGRRLATCSSDGTVLVWDLAGPAEQLTPARLQALWADLASPDAERAYRAVWALAGSPREAAAFIGERLRPVDLKAAEGLVRDLGDRRFATREKAAQQLETLGEGTRPALLKALQGEAPLEARRRVQQVLARLDTLKAAATLRARRAVEALESGATAETREALRVLADSAPEAAVRAEAQAALRRLARR